nr:hypothetical protein [Mucilaginibacter sp. FT3.2]
MSAGIYLFNLLALLMFDFIVICFEWDKVAMKEAADFSLR